MKILHVHKYFYMRAGAERYMLGLMRLQEEAGHTVAPFSMHYPKNIKTPWSEFFVSEMKTEGKFVLGLSFVRQFIRALWSLKAQKQMNLMLDVFKPDIVHIHNIYTHLSPSILRSCKVRGIPVVMTVHDFSLLSANYAMWDGEHPLKPEDLDLIGVVKSKYIKNSYLATFGLEIVNRIQKFFGFYNNNIDRYFAISNFMKDYLIRGGYDQEKIKVIYNFADLKFKKPRKKTKDIVFVGRVEDYKGIGTLIEAMADYPGIPLKIAGTGGGEMQFRKMAKDMDNVEFLGFVSGEDLEELLETARVVVIPSIWNEPFGLVAVEAMSKGTAVIVSDAGALPEIVEDHVSGRVFIAGDSRDLSRVLCDFIKSEEYARSIGDASYKRAKEISDPQKHLKKIMQEYADVIGNKQ